MKSPNLDYRRLADQLIDKGMIAESSMQHVFQECSAHGLLMPEVLVNEDLISDLEIARICTELFHLPFIPLESYKPDEAAFEGLDREYLHRYGLIPLDRFGNLMTVSMPGIVPSSVLDGLCDDESISILPVVGSVISNRRWLKENLATEENMAMEAFKAAVTDEEASWGDLFDEGDESVQFDLQDEDGKLMADGLDMEMPSLEMDDMDFEQKLEDKPSPETKEDDDMFDLDALDDLN